MAELALYSPEWWLKRLIARLRAQRLECTEYYDFYEGHQPLAFASDSFNETFGRRYRRLPANFMPRVVDAERERLVVQGFRFGGESAPDKSIWRIWQDNQMDAESQIAHEIALCKGVAYALVAPPNGHPSPLITIEDPYETTLETAPGNRRLRLAALKVWLDDDGYMRAYLYLPDFIYKYRSAQKRVDDGSWSWESTTWQPYIEESEDFPVANKLGVVPVIPLLNRPRRDGTGRSEIKNVMGNQNAINKLRFDALVASEAVAFPQRWMTNIDIPIDPDTGKPVSPFKPGVTQIWATRKPAADEIAEYGTGQFPQPAFGQFPQADLKPYIDMIREEVVEMAAISGTPYYQLVGPPTSVAPSGESVKASEAALVKKVEAQEVHFGEGWEEVGRVVLMASGQTSKARSDGETIWKDAETRNEAARTDSILKQYVAGLLPDELAMEELGYSPQQIERARALKLAKAAKVASGAPQITLDQPTAPVIRSFGRDARGNPIITRSA
jgi:hypothetical protein